MVTVTLFLVVYIVSLISKFHQTMCSVVSYFLATVEIDLNAKETQDFSMRATERATTIIETSRAAFFI